MDHSRWPNGPQSVTERTTVGGRTVHSRRPNGSQSVAELYHSLWPVGSGYGGVTD